MRTKPDGDTEVGAWTELLVLMGKDGMGVRSLSRASGVSVGHVSDLAAGRRMPTSRIVKLFAETLNVPVSMLERRRWNEGPVGPEAA